MLQACNSHAHSKQAHAEAAALQAIAEESSLDWMLYHYAKQRLKDYVAAHVPSLRTQLKNYMDTWGTTECSTGTLDHEDLHSLPG